MFTSSRMGTLRSSRITRAGTAGADPTPQPSPGYVIQGGPGGTNRRWSEKFAASLRRAAAGLRRELVTGHWKLGFPAGDLSALADVCLNK
jgi:hypothetical protein